MNRRRALHTLAWGPGAWLAVGAAGGAPSAQAQATAPPPPPPPLRVLCAGAVKGALQALAPAWAARGGTPWQATYAPAGELRRLLAAGTPADVLVLPAETLDDTDRSGLTSAADRAPLGAVGIGVAVKAGAPLPDISTESALRRTLLATPSLTYMDPERGTSGRHVDVVVLRQLDILEAVRFKTVLGEGGLLAEAVARGEVAMALQQMTELQAVPGVQVVGPLPPTLQKTTVYVGVPLRTSPQREPALALLAWLRQPGQQAVFAGLGFSAP